MDPVEHWFSRRDSEESRKGGGGLNAKKRQNLNESKKFSTAKKLVWRKNKYGDYKRKMINGTERLMKKQKKRQATELRIIKKIIFL